jgi:hypothetical protein
METFPDILISTVIAVVVAGFPGQISCSEPADEQMSDSEQTESASVDDPLTPHAWENRPLLIFAPSEDNTSRSAQLKRLNNWRAGLMERDMVIYQVFEESGLGPFGRLTTHEVDAFREKYDVASREETLILVGKDTTEKLRETLPVKVQTIFDLIDSMPMRQREMQNESQK